MKSLRPAGKVMLILLIILLALSLSTMAGCRVFVSLFGDGADDNGDEPNGTDDPYNGDSGADAENSDPVAAAGADATTVYVGAAVALNADGCSDPDGDELSYAWTLSGPNGSAATLSAAETAGPSFTPDLVGDYICTLSVSDGHGGSADATVTVTAEALPTVAIEDDIVADTRWTAPTVYTLSGSIDIAGATLTIEPGVTVAFEANAGLRVSGDAAALIAQGDADTPITFTGTLESPGFWKGISVNSDNPQNLLRYAVVEYAGGEVWSYLDEAANVAVDDGASVEIANCTLRHGEAYGIHADPDAALPDFAGSSMSGNDYPLSLSLPLVGALDATSTYTGNTHDAVVVHDLDSTESLRFAAVGVPYHLPSGDYTAEGTAIVTIEPGVTLAFGAGSGLRVNADGAAIVAEGSAAEPITMTGLQESAGFWKGIGIFSDNAFNSLSYVTIVYGGSATWSFMDDAANLAVDEGSRIAVTNTTLRHSGAYGLHVDPGGLLTEFASNSFTDNQVPINMPMTLMGVMDTASSYTGNSSDYLRVTDEHVTEDMRVEQTDVPFRFDEDAIYEIDGTAAVSIDAGVTMEFAVGAGLLVDTDGAYLDVAGTSASPVTFTGVQKAVGSWDGLAFYSSNSFNSLDYVTIEYGGGRVWSFIDEAANLSLGDGSRLSLSNSVLRHSPGYGGWADDGLAAEISFSNNSYSDNASGANNYGE